MQAAKPQEVTPTASPVCTRVCTSNPGNDNAGTLDAPAVTPNEGEGADQGDPLAKIADALLTLSPADRAKLAALLTGQQADSEGNETQ